MFKFLPFLFLCYFTDATFSHAQTDTISSWTRSIQTGINLNQASFSNNWKGGGVNSIAVGLLLNARANYETENTSFVNEVQLLYGVVNNEGQSLRKTSDRIFLDSKYGYKFSSKWNAFFSLNFQSQFGKGFKYSEDVLGREVETLISTFMAPGYLTSSLGIEYKPVTYFWMRFGLGTLRQTFVLDENLYLTEPSNYGVEIGNQVRNEVAFQFIADFNKDIAENLNLQTRFTAFGNYHTLHAIDTRIDVLLTAAVNKFINVNFSGTILYDEDMDTEIQYSQGLSLGISFSFSEFPE